MTNSQIRSNLRRAILESGKKSKEIALEMKVHESQVSRWVNKKASPSSEVLENLCKVLNVSISEIYGEKIREIKNNLVVNENKPDKIENIRNDSNGEGNMIDIMNYIRLLEKENTYLREENGHMRQEIQSIKEKK